jgi:hypothetical protein
MSALIRYSTCIEPKAIEAMPALLHEYWASDTCGQFSPVRMENDQKRPLITPGARLVFSLWASSWFEAIQSYQERLDYGDYKPPEGVSDTIYTDAEMADQQTWLKVRALDQ